MTVHKEPAGGFWTFESPLEPQFEVPTIEELQVVWTEAPAAHDTVALDDDYYGLFEKTERQPAAIVSLDLCEVLRETGFSLERVYGGALSTERRQKLTHDTSYMALYSAWQGLEIGDADTSRAVLQQFMYRKQVDPVPYHEAIQAFLQRWRANDIYVIANTSTLPGCEASTVRFLAETYPGSVRGALFPRNFDGLGTLTKAGILEHFKEKAASETSFDFTMPPTVVIEDAPHHAIDFPKTVDDVQVFMPAYKWNEELESEPAITRVAQNFGTVDTFIAADNYLQSRGIIK